ncbi:MAG TPA: hypothetical protein VD968_11125 [Pyrinomonadaceae bacterium]|nr:hypothetical protein [Pyrinomonadaceae bacterium]
MKRTFLLLSAACLLAALSVSAAAQTAGPPKVFLFEREELKPGAFDAHLREANNFARMLAHARKAGEPAYVRLGMFPVAGNYNEVFYAYPFNSLEQWAQSQRDIQRWMSTPGPMRTYFESIAGPQRPAEDLHTSVRSMVAVYRPELSLNPRQSLAKARYVSLSTMRVKMGHYGDFMKLAGMYTDAMKRMKGDHHWAMYEVVGGAPEGTFLILSSMEKLAEMDAMMANASEFPKAMGDKLDDFEKLMAASIESMATNIYAINGRMSSVPAEYMAADPAFWSQELPAPPTSTTATASKKRQK